MPLNAHLHDLLLSLEKLHMQDLDWVPTGGIAHVPHHTRQQAVREGLVEAQGQTARRVYRLTKRGYSALGSNADYYLEQLKDTQPLALVQPLQGKSRLCKVDGCSEPRVKHRSLCRKHLDEQRESQRRQLPVQQAVVISSSVRPGGIVHEKLPEPSTISFPEPIQQAVESVCGPDCRNCTYKEALEIIARRDPAALHLVEALRKLDGHDA